MSLLFGYAATYDLNDIPFVVLDQDHSFASRELVARLEGNDTFHRAATVDNPAALRAAIDSRRALLAVQIGQDFERRLLAGQPAAIQVIADGRNSNSAA